MKFLVYKITNIINNKIYIGCHQTKNINDNYMGSGLHLKRGQKKYGLENFIKEILFFFDNSEEMFSKEKELVNKDFISRKDTYNLKEGGKNWDYLTALKGRLIANKNGAQEKALKRIKWLRENDLIWKEERKRKHLESITEFYKYNKGSFSGRNHTKESKSKMSKKKKDINFQKGETNSQYGTCWIFNQDLKENKKIKKEDLNDFIENGWLKGRRMKF